METFQAKPGCVYVNENVPFENKNWLIVKAKCTLVCVFDEGVFLESLAHHRCKYAPPVMWSRRCWLGFELVVVLLSVII